MDEDTVTLAGEFINFGILKQKSFDDCRHIAAAILSSWYFKHIVNVKIARGVKALKSQSDFNRRRKMGNLAHELIDELPYENTGRQNGASGPANGALVHPRGLGIPLEEVFADV